MNKSEEINNSNLIKNHLYEIKMNINYINIKSDIKNHKKSTVLTQFKKELIDKKTAWDDIYTIVSFHINNDHEYLHSRKRIELIKNRMKDLFIINEINFSITSDTKTVSVYESRLIKEEGKKLVKKYKTNKVNKNKQRIVAESEYSFSDDSLDYSIMPIV
jgi:hypothetical protein